jgi:ADP-ribose pyrophosphatase YjhB (NUDIX family)
MTAPKVRATAVLIENDQILLVQQRVDDRRSWSLPGGTLESGETLGSCLVREVCEETGLDVVLDRLLYVCDRLDVGRQVVHVTFAVRRNGGQVRVGQEPESDAEPIHDVRFVPLDDLCDYGFSVRFRDLARTGFLTGGTYQGPVSNIGL